jgi:tetratricopeptide (TPR) repeat protein
MINCVRCIAACFGLIMLMAGPVQAHDSINAEARKNYLSKLQELQASAAASSPSAVRAKSLYQIGVTLDEIRELFNQDIISHGIVKGLETSLLLNELTRIGNKLEASPKTGLYLSQLQYYREAIRLDPRAPFIDHARYMLLKSHFYDSFSDNPLSPFSQSKETLAEMIGIGEGLLKVKHPQINGEELRFILGIHYLQAIKQQQGDKEDTLKKLKKMVQELHKDYPQSLKLLTLESLMS